MIDLAIVVPTRGRPERFVELVHAIQATAAGDVLIVSAVDDDDPSDYATPLLGQEINLVAYRGERRSLSGWTNHLAQHLLHSPAPPRYLASLGDDHRPRTPGWDRLLIEAIEHLDGPGFAYGNDLLQGELMPTAWVASADVVRALGWMMLPGCQHMYVDTAVLTLGRAAGRIAYRADVVIEHIHPLAGKTGWDDSYRASNAPERYQADKAAYETWRDGGQLAADVALLEDLHHRATTTA